MAKIQLIKTPTYHETMLIDRWYVPLDLVWIGTYLRNHGHEVEILDGQVLSVEGIQDQINAQIVGITFNILSSSVLDKIVEAAKEKNAIVIVGGQAATPLAHQLLRGNKNVDAVVQYDGEEAMRQIAEAIDRKVNPFSCTTNLVYRQNRNIIENPVSEVDFFHMPMPDRTIDGIDFENYVNSFLATNTEKGIDGVRVTNVHSKKGCSRRCSFCARIDKKVRARTPLQTYQEYRFLNKEFNIDYIFDHSDNWIVDNWLEEFIRIYETEGVLDLKLMIFGDVRDITRDVVRKLKLIKVDNLLMGIESTDEELLRKNGKPLTRWQILEAIRLLREEEIKVSLSYVLGLSGETTLSVLETLEFTQSLKESDDKIVNYCNIIMPLPGSRQWNLMMQVPELKGKYYDKYSFELMQLRNDYFKHFCTLGDNPYFFLEQTRNSILSENELKAIEYAR